MLLIESLDQNVIRAIRELSDKDCYLRTVRVTAAV